MSEQEEVIIKLTKDQALVLFEFLARTNEADHTELFVDQVELKMLWLLEGQARKTISGAFLKELLFHRCRGQK
ncbi:hypothetical protein ACFQT0_07315 [Hymenobacter humi]|uniref:Uncharacterized protein n=1 Tax=Hymenobacter humi TaxID=1411620 RepID=A0ABW2U4I7_9BACT